MRLARQAACARTLRIWRRARYRGAGTGRASYRHENPHSRRRTSASDKDRDAARKPIESLQFLGIKTGRASST